MKTKQVLLAISIGALFAGQPAFAASVATGSVVTLGNGPGTLAGEFLGSVISGSGAGETFNTFCLEHNEYFDSYGQSLYVKNVNTGAVNGGVSRADVTYSSYTFVGSSAPTSTFDPVSYGTAYLYTQFRAGTLSNYDYSSSSLRPGDANSLQRAIWFMEGEQTLADISSDTQAIDWVKEAKTANWTSLGNVRVLNLYKDAAFTDRSQDQLYLMPIPEPETYAMLLAGLGLMGVVARRRKQNTA